MTKNQITPEDLELLRKLQNGVWTNSKQAGELPYILLPEDKRPAAEQLDARYSHGGGFMPFPKGHWELANSEQSGNATITYSSGELGDPPCHEVSRTKLNDQTLILFQPGTWLAIVEPDGEFEITRVD